MRCEEQTILACMRQQKKQWSRTCRNDKKKKKTCEKTVASVFVINAVLTPALFGMDYTRKVSGLDILNWCEYKPINSSSSPRPHRGGGLR